MLETLAVFVGLCITLYLLFWSLDAITGRLQSRRDNRSIAVDLVDAVGESPISIGEYHAPVAGCVIEAGLCPETAETIGAFGEGIQGALEVAGESLSNAISGL
jgi:hypothetical protein